MIRSASLAVIAALLAVGGAIPAASPVAAAPPSDCPATMPISEVAEGMTGIGYTVVRGETPQAFDVEVLGTYPNGIAPDHDLILVRVHDQDGSTIIKDAGGIWAGMSGSPVVIDGKLVGAIAYGFSQGPSTFGGVTPINEMLQVASRPRMVEAAAPLALSGAALRAIDRVAPAAAGPFVRLPLPITMPMRTNIRTKGVKSATRVARMRARADLSVALRRAGFDLVGTTGGRSIKAAASGGPIGSGDDIAVSLATGDALTAATGTVTWTCDQKLLAFGHPMLQTGASNLGAHQARAIDVVDDSVLGPFHLAVPGALVGRVVEDRLPAIGVRLDQEPRHELHVTSTTTDGTASRNGTSDVSAESASLRSSLVGLHARANVTATSEADAEGSVSVTMHATGSRDDGSPFDVTFGDRVIASEGPVGEFYTVPEAAEAVAGSYVAWLDMNGNEDVTIETVDMDIDVGAPARWVIEQVLVRSGQGSFRPMTGKLSVKSGGTLTVQFRLAKSSVRGSWSTPGPNAERITKEVVMQVPRSGSTITAGHGTGLELFWFEPVATGSFDALLTTLSSRVRADELFVTIGSSTKRLQLDRIVAGPRARAQLVR